MINSKPNYNLMSLKELEQYILKNKHLPDVPTQNEISKMVWMRMR